MKVTVEDVLGVHTVGFAYSDEDEKALVRAADRVLDTHDLRLTPEVKRLFEALKDARKTNAALILSKKRKRRAA